MEDEARPSAPANHDCTSYLAPDTNSTFITNNVYPNIYVQFPLQRWSIDCGSVDFQSKGGSFQYRVHPTPVPRKDSARETRVMVRYLVNFIFCKTTTMNLATLLFILHMSLLSADSSSSSSPTDSLNAFWRKAANVVETGDFDTYASMYHPDAVLVSTTTSSDASTKPISEALLEWKAGFEETAAGRQQVQLSFRFSSKQRIDGPTTAHETGIFRYASSSRTTTTKQGDVDDDDTTKQQHQLVIFLHFESLLVKKPDRGWLWMMEFQKHAATREEWDALEPLPPQDTTTIESEE